MTDPILDELVVKVENHMVYTYVHTPLPADIEESLVACRDEIEKSDFTEDEVYCEWKNQFGNRW